MVIGNTEGMPTNQSMDNGGDIGKSAAASSSAPCLGLVRLNYPVTNNHTHQNRTADDDKTNSVPFTPTNNVSGPKKKVKRSLLSPQEELLTRQVELLEKQVEVLQERNNIENRRLKLEEERNTIFYSILNHISNIYNVD